jgi:2-oxoglutarate ferredoxin oxidoreductase subunit gamma
MLKQVTIAGFGGQGVLLMGQLLVYAGMREDKEVTWSPAYGAEMRGGNASCLVSIADSFINAPLFAEPDILVAMNELALDKFEASLEPGGSLFINSSLIDRKARRQDVKVYYIPANDCADALGEPRVANMVMLGAVLAAESLVKSESILAVLEKTMASKKHLLPLNSQALDKGAELV